MKHSYFRVFDVIMLFDISFPHIYKLLCIMTDGGRLSYCRSPSPKGWLPTTYRHDTVHFKADSHIACRAHAVPLPCRAAKGLECVFHIWFIQCGRVWFTPAKPCSDHAVLLKATAQHGRRETAVLCRGLEKNGMVGAWHGKCESDTAALCKSNGKDTF